MACNRKVHLRVFESVGKTAKPRAANNTNIGGKVNLALQIFNDDRDALIDCNICTK